MIHYVEGDLFLNKYSVSSFAQGVNVVGVTGGGISGTFKKLYPKMDEQYKIFCKTGNFKPGSLYFWKELGKSSVYNLATQDDPGANARYEWVEESLKTMLLHMINQNILSSSMPAIGAGIGGLTWTKVRDIIDNVFKDWSGNLYVYEKYIPNQP